MIDTTTLRTHSVEHYSAVAKPCGSTCNMNCSYCFYLHKDNLLYQGNTTEMSFDLLELHIKQYLEAQHGHYVEFIWQGGEPTLLGLDYFKKAVALQEKHTKPGQQVLNSFQTNGMKINKAWCEFFVKHDFLIGLSIDGPKHIHDLHRRNIAGKSTFDRVEKAAHILKKSGVTFNVLCAVNSSNSKHPKEVYRYIRDKINPHVIQFTPVVQTPDFESIPSFSTTLPFTIKANVSKQQSCVTDWSVTPKNWGQFLVAIWDEWFNNDFGEVFIENFEDVTAITLGYGSQKCTSSAQCGKGLAIEHNGDVYSCDHFAYSDYYLGNITETHQGDLLASSQQKQFGAAKSTTLPLYCKNCQYLNYCQGECPKNRILSSPDGEPGLNYLCVGQKMFYKRVLSSSPELLRRIDSRQQ
ncbi:anaerobic sulfatase maturase [Vibrio sp. 10N.222.51.C12]|uniref:anaerobic sulfatase maturase n=1 Tax=unclassified Vibrio TaxID=2614977 RepID=UPI000C863920|nr:anaerobic sulfatase maturase [Vibrio sp. 10N.286.48.B7]PMH81197.1 anaerobic sulfatase maturase [Vibrio sp. 10N.286.48.B7]